MARGRTAATPVPELVEARDRKLQGLGGLLSELQFWNAAGGGGDGQPIIAEGGISM